MLKRATILGVSLILWIAYSQAGAGASPSLTAFQETAKATAVKKGGGRSQATEFSAALKAAANNLTSEEGRRYSSAAQDQLVSWLTLGMSPRLAEQLSPGGMMILACIGLSGTIEEILVLPDTAATRRMKAEIPRSGYGTPPGLSWWIMIGHGSGDVEGKVDNDRPRFKTLEGSGIVYGEGLGALVTAPENWMFDMESGVSQGLHAVMYPQGSSWERGGEVMYVNFGVLKSGDTMGAFIAGDIEDFKRKAPGIEIKTLEPITLASGEEAQVRAFSGDPFGNHEGIAYAQYGTGMAVFILTCRSKEGYDKSVGLFREMVSRSALMKMTFGDRPPIPTETKSKTGNLGQRLAPPDAAELPSGGYAYWSKFRPETFVSFKYSMKSGQTSQDMLKTVTLKKVTPETVALEYRESPCAGPSRPAPETSSSLYLKTPFEFREADDEFESHDPFGPLLGFDVTRILKDPQGTRIGNGREELDWKGGKLQASWTKLRFGGPDALMTITVWLSDGVPGGLFKLVKELEGAASFREEVAVEDCRAVMAGPAELERLRTSRKPSLIEIPANTYFMNRFRFFSRLGDFQSSLKTALAGLPNGEAPEPGKLAVEYLEKLRSIKSDFDDDKQKAAAELGPDEMAKLTPLLGQAERYFMLDLRLAEIMVEAIERTRNHSIDEASLAALMEAASNIKAEILSAMQGQKDAFKKLKGISVKFLRNPTTR